MFWADRIAKNIVDSGKFKPYWVDDMKTPSGRIHVGSLRGVIIHDLVYKALRHAGAAATFTYVFEDHDPMDAMPHYLDAKEWSKYLGQPLFTIPSPDGKAKSYAQCFAQEFEGVFNKIGAVPKIIWTSELYRTGKMNEGIKTILDNVTTIRDIYNEMYEKKMPADWYPFQVVCPKCQKESTTRVSNWDGKEVTFTCKVDAVDWTRGCGYSGKTSPFSENGVYRGKLSWKVEWPVKWMVIGVTVEGAGKDHMSAGGSHDVAKLICDQVLHSPVPYPVPYEFFLIGGKKMSSSKGLGSSAKEVSDILPPYLLRFLFTRTDYNQAIDFDPVGNMYIPDLFDEYDRCWQEYNQGKDENLIRAFELSQIGELPAKMPNLFIPRFRDIANFYQLPNVNLFEKFAEMKGAELTDVEEKMLGDRLTHAINWVANYAPEEYKYQISTKNYNEITLDDDQWDFLNKLAPIWKEAKDPEKLQSELFALIKELTIDPKKAFTALYQVLLDKSHGPRAGWLMKKFSENVNVVLDRLTLNKKPSNSKVQSVQFISQPEFFSVAEQVKNMYPSVSVGIALLKNVEIQKTSSDLEKEKAVVVDSLKELTTEMLGTFPEVISYRKLYKQMRIDWHSRRPSPEALLRRVALKKGLYTVNTCVDAYNLVVMKHRVSVGAFDADQIKLPTKLRFAGEGDGILLLGDSELTQYTAKELAYYDQKGGFNLDFNYRDAQRTKVTEETKNIWINVDGIFAITPEQVEQVLKEAVTRIQKYCGGTVEFQGVVT